MSWLCGGSGVPKEDTIEAGRRALAQHRWDHGKHKLDQAWKRDPASHKTIVDLCERSVDKATSKYQALGDGPAPLPPPLHAAPEGEPDKEALEKLQKEQAARKKEHANQKNASLAKLHRWHYLAKRYNKRLMDKVDDPVVVGRVCTHVGLHHKALSATSPKGYDPKHNQRAFDYFSRAIASYDEAHLPQPAPVAGRMDVVAERLMHTSEHWYKVHQKRKLQDASGLILSDFVRLINMPTSLEERLQNLDSLASLLERELPVEAHEFMLREVMGPLTNWLRETSADAALLRVPVLQVFQQIIEHQSWAKHDAGDALHRFISDESIDLTLEHMQVLRPCYRGLIAKDKAHGRYDILPDLDILRNRLQTNEKALVQVLVLLDDVGSYGAGSKRADALKMALDIGTKSTADSVVYSTLVVLDHLAAADERIDRPSTALEDMATMISTIKNPDLRDYGIVRIAFHNIHPNRLDAAEHALYTTLGLKDSDVKRLLKRHDDNCEKISQIEAEHTTVAL